MRYEMRMGEMRGEDGVRVGQEGRAGEWLVDE